VGEYAATEGELDASAMRFAIAVARFNRDITEALLDGAETVLRKHDAVDVSVAWVPGAFELPLVAQRFARSGAVDAVICLGAVVRGDTPHFEYVAGEVAAGIQRVTIDTGVPVVFGVLTVDTHEQALERVGGKEGHKGEEAALTAIEMVSLLKGLP
jgi:6,7-dimethyl-8-ribityllumazine synthase